MNRMTENDDCHFGTEGVSQHEKVKMLPTRNPTIAMLMCLPLSNPRPMTLFLLRQCCEKLLLVSYDDVFDSGIGFEVGGYRIESAMKSGPARVNCAGWLETVKGAEHRREIIDAASRCSGFECLARLGMLSHLSKLKK